MIEQSAVTNGSNSLTHVGQTVVPMEAGTECYIWASGYSGPSGEPYKLKLWMTPEEV